MSRLLVKGLPADYTSAALSKEFAKEGFAVTDCKVLMKHGVSRRMAFVGLTTAEEGMRAIDRMDKVWVQGGRLAVEEAREADKELFSRPVKKRKLDVPAPADVDEIIEDGVAQDEGLTDAEYLAKRRKRTLGSTYEAPAVEVTESEPFQNARLFLRNLPFTVTADDLEAYFKPFGEITEVKLPTAAKGQGTGLGYISFISKSSAQKAHAELDGKPFMGRLLHVLPAIDKRETAEFKGKVLKDLLAGGKPRKDFDKSLQRHDQARGDNATLVLNVGFRLLLRST
jgi:RNA recognition motif-containing protein